ncbi:MAG: indolepyruvate oxidoreductase subunit beta [Firmicutes bacterium HGW-Firmicutes-1]|jgi:indolepyruvate ferredoxin oxidoreductase beta subunit|nr:MAG: indolepyruvate oxidoreductase subunit beta [Firmicutes bacterium HGW-Firmicutes-1]
MTTNNILVVGVGGQGTLITSRILGNLAMSLGYDVKLSEVHGMAQRGGSVVTHIRYGEKVHSPLVEVGQADIIVSFEKLEALRWKHFLKEDGIMLVNTQEIDPMPVIIGTSTYPEDIIEQLEQECENVIAIDALSRAKELGNIKVANTILLGLLAKNMSIPKDKWIEIIKSTVPQKTIDINIAAFENGYAIV